jgi:hypothetical protein
MTETEKGGLEGLKSLNPPAPPIFYPPTPGPDKGYFKLFKVFRKRK